MCLLICSAEYTAFFVPRQQETISKSNCLLAACQNAAGTGLLAFPSISPRVIPSHFIPVNLELGQNMDFGKSLAFLSVWTIRYKPLFFFFPLCFWQWWYLLLFCRKRVEGGSAWPTCTAVVCGTSCPFWCLSEAVKVWVLGLQLCKNKSWCWFNPITLRWSLSHWTLSRIPALIL